MVGRREQTPVTEDVKLKGFDDFDLQLGDVMRGERATMGKSLLDVQRELKIKAAYIAAIEHSDPTAFETQGFVAGYVRSYARYLGLDPEWAYSRFCQESNFATQDGMSSGASAKAKRPEKKKASSDPLGDPQALFIPRSEGFLPQIEASAIGSVLVMVMLVSALGYGGWAVFREIQKVQFVPVDQTPGISTEVDVLAAEVALLDADADALPVAPTTEAIDRLYRPGALDVPILEPRDEPIARLNPAEVGTLAPPAPVATVLAEIEADLALEVAEPAIQVVEDAPDEVLVFAVRPSWIRVQSADGTVLFEKILDAGEQYVLPQSETPPVLRAGNAGSLYFAINGETFGPAGTGPAVVKNVALSPENLQASYQPANPDNDSDLARYFAMVEAEAAELEEPAQ